jgi:16S rRNA (cytosine1402-N4)-methyltransferase
MSSSPNFSEFTGRRPACPALRRASGSAWESAVLAFAIDARTMSGLSEAVPETFSHEPVLANEVLKYVDPGPGQVVLDGTVGLGGHASLILPRLGSAGRYIGLDVDPEMIERARALLAPPAGVELNLVRANYAQFPDVLRELGCPRVDHMLLDLGVNSAQLDDPARGFSFDREGPLDMRFDRQQKRQALDLVNSLSETELADIFYEFGQEGASRKIAKRICQLRHTGRITTTRVLAAAVESLFAAGAARQVGKTHPATRVFQALRVAVNRELDNLRQFLDQVLEFLSPGGTVVIISFHSLEDGLVKEFFRSASAQGQLTELTRRPEVAGASERNRNPRSRSAKLRAARRLDFAATEVSQQGGSRQWD